MVPATSSQEEIAKCRGYQETENRVGSVVAPISGLALTLIEPQCRRCGEACAIPDANRVASVITVMIPRRVCISGTVLACAQYVDAYRVELEVASAVAAADAALVNRFRCERLTRVRPRLEQPRRAFDRLSLFAWAGAEVNFRLRFAVHLDCCVPLRHSEAATDFVGAFCFGRNRDLQLKDELVEFIYTLSPRSARERIDCQRFGRATDGASTASASHNARSRRTGKSGRTFFADWSRFARSRWTGGTGCADRSGWPRRSSPSAQLLEDAGPNLAGAGDEVAIGCDCCAT